MGMLCANKTLLKKEVESQIWPSVMLSNPAYIISHLCPLLLLNALHEQPFPAPSSVCLLPVLPRSVPVLPLSLLTQG